MKTEIKQQVTNENNITVNIDQDPMKQLLYWCQTSYKLQVQCFSSAIIFTIQPNYSSTNRASRASEYYVQIEVSSSRVFPSPATNPFLIFCRSIYRKMRRWDFNKISQGQLMQSEDFSALWEARGKNLQVDHYINCFTINIKARWKLCLTLRLCVCFGITLQIFIYWFPCRNNLLAMLEADISSSNNFGLCSEWFEATGGSL